MGRRKGKGKGVKVVWYFNFEKGLSGVDGKNLGVYLLLEKVFTHCFPHLSLVYEEEKLEKNGVSRFREKIKSTHNITLHFHLCIHC